MTQKPRSEFPLPSEAALERVRQRVARSLSPEEVRQRLEHQPSPEDIAEMRGLIRWFQARYPTPSSRLAYARRAAARWAKSQPEARRHPRGRGAQPTVSTE